MICAFGCNQEAKFTDRCGKPCCSEHRENCPSVISKITEKVLCDKCNNFFSKNGINKHKTICLLGICLNCNKPINKNKKFCNQSCSATYNNKLHPKRERGFNYKKAIVNGNEIITKYKIEGRGEQCISCNNKLEKTQNLYCSRKCQHNYKYELYIQDYLKGMNNGSNKDFTTSGHLRRYLFEQSNYKCNKCGLSQYHPITNKTILQIHHVDGNWTNNKLENLQVLCPNCHAMSDTFRGLNETKELNLPIRPPRKYTNRNRKFLNQ